ncbi:MAG: chromosome segregation protein SMC, partial [Acidimicrobiia bacterium]|nr:chromosome segregation protein SMC [Acidimicrobiia bacterium]
SLTFDNSTGQLPLDLAEVTVTRRLYRDGSSDYEINGVECRLLDIQELLSDSGVGRHQHVVVGQGQLDAVLNAKPGDHRAIIEEAAGILKHRLRKDRSIRRLERTDADVLRLLDILKELKRQIRPLRRQAEDAERHDGLKAAVTALRLYLGGEDLRGLGWRMEAAAAEEADLRPRTELAESELVDLEVSLEPLAEAAGEAGRALDRDTAAAARLETTAERLRSIASVASERRRGLAARLEGAGERRSDLQREAEDLDVSLALSIESERQAAEETERTERVLSALEDEERSLAEQESMPTEGAVAMVRGDLRSLQAALERDNRERHQVARRLETLKAQIELESTEIERTIHDIQQLDVGQGSAQAASEKATTARQADQATFEQLEDEAKVADLTVAAARARVEALENAVAGLADPVARRRAEQVESVVGPLSGALDIPEEMAAAVDAALGSWADALLVDEPGSIARVVGTLKSGGMGGLPMVAVASDRTEPPARAVAASWGLEALVDVLGAGSNTVVATALLGDVVVAEGWSAGWELVRRHPQIRVVTPEGDLLTGVGVRVAHPDGATPAMLEAAQVAAEAADQEAARCRSRLTTARRAFEQSRTAQRAATEALEAAEARLAGSTEALGRLERSRTGLSEEVTRLEARRTSLAEAGSEREEQIARLQERLAALEGKEAERQSAWEALARRRQEVAARRDEARRARQEAAAAHGAVVERNAMLVRRLEEVRAELLDLEEHPVDPAQVAHLEQIEGHSRQVLEVVRTHLESLRERQIILRSEAGAAGARLSEARRRRDELQHEVSRSKDRLSKLGIEMAELKVRLESTAEGLRRDADVDEAEALNAPRPDLDESVDLRDRLQQLDAQLRRMGPVNPLAAEEYRDLSERHDFMRGQLDDLEQARDELRKVISALDEKIEELFTEAFHEVAGYYEQNFEILFPGGRGTLTLTEPDDLLVSGVDIKAQPLGKKVSRLQLLSGGERSLAALAFLFAVFKARPSPFYVMDEVEAALDDANLRRFLKLAEDFRGSAQLMIVTHQQQTMEVADVLYGVTMEPGGSSQVIAKRMAGQMAFDPA